MSKKPTGRPFFIPTAADRKTASAMASTGFTHEAIARCIGTDGIDPKTLREHFRKELDTAADKANAKVATVAYKKALQGEPWAVCFWLKCRAGWKEKSEMEHTGAVQVVVEYGVEAAKS